MIKPVDQEEKSVLTPGKIQMTSNLLITGLFSFISADRNFYTDLVSTFDWKKESKFILNWNRKHKSWLGDHTEPSQKWTNNHLN